LQQVILDSSATIQWFVPDERNSAAQNLLDRVIEDGAVVPVHWTIEVGNALLIAMRRRRIAPAQRDNAITQLIDLQITIDRETLDRLWTTTLALSDRYSLTLYDACYLELAQRRELPLATLDADLRKAARAAGVTLVAV
jgi:predicted nucleic acid-binding protein